MDIASSASMAAMTTASVSPEGSRHARASGDMVVVRRRPACRRRSISRRLAIVKTHLRKASSSPSNRGRPAAMSSQTSEATSSASNGSLLRRYAKTFG